MSRTKAVRPLLTAVALATAAAAIAVPARQALEARSRESVLTAANDAWLNRLTGKHRQLFDMPSPNGGIPLVHILNFYDTYNKAYGVGDLDVNAIGTFYGATTFYGLNDAMWAKYRLGEFSETTDPATGKPAVVNPWRTAPVILGMTLPQASIEALQLRGATFIICDNALGIFASLVAKARGLDPAAVDADFKANILPGVTRVPGMVVAIQKAQEKGITYHRQ
jgi:intracellular sulfur oxidation DsrE/DsrF family protein